ncbi:T9SS type A sorting domain-containing protein [uncultured Dokdonia sp.]|uniref:T9SS type A sorting domain-containing protein n=1 Tax=uncultured Dokdonia sp. TaxID=575653 RepID=UPI0026210590|nr:T9SS type A sorting domain-containing protein [uncultured Dokdonia sp.]
MKKHILFISILLFPLVGLSQEEDLFANEWILHYMVIDGETTVSTVSSATIVFNDPSTGFDVYATVNGFNYYAEFAPPTVFNEDSFIVNEGGVTLGDCESDCELEDQYLGTILFGFDREFDYEIIDESNGDKILIITTPEGNVAVHGNYSLSLDEFVKRNIKIYPTPTENVLHINSKELPIQSINVFSLLGTNVFETNNIYQNYSMDVSFLKRGVYFVKITFKNGNDYMHKFIKK